MFLRQFVGEPFKRLFLIKSNKVTELFSRVNLEQVLKLFSVFLLLQSRDNTYLAI